MDSCGYKSNQSVKEVRNLKLNKDELFKSMGVHNYTVTQLAKEMGVSRSALHKVISGQRAPGNKILEGVTKVFGREEAINILGI